MGCHTLRTVALLEGYQGLPHWKVQENEGAGGFVPSHPQQVHSHLDSWIFTAGGSMRLVPTSLSVLCTPTCFTVVCLPAAQQLVGSPFALSVCFEILRSGPGHGPIHRMFTDPGLGVPETARQACT